MYLLLQRITGYDSSLSSALVGRVPPSHWERAISSATHNVKMPQDLKLGLGFNASAGIMLDIITSFSRAENLSKFQECIVGALPPAPEHSTGGE